MGTGTDSPFPIKESNGIVQIPMLTHTCPGDNLQYYFFSPHFPSKLKTERFLFHLARLFVDIGDGDNEERERKRRTFSIKVVSFFLSNDKCIEPRVFIRMKCRGELVGVHIAIQLTVSSSISVYIGNSSVYDCVLVL